MALVIGTNCGFVTVAPSADPDDTDRSIDTLAWASRFTTPSGVTNITVTEIGWYCDNATEAADFEVGIYADTGDTAGAKTYGSAATAKGTTLGWKKVTGLSISLDANTKYWIAAQLDDTATATNTNRTVTEGGSSDFIGKGAQTSLPDPFEKNVGPYAYDALGVYALITYDTPEGTQDGPYVY